MPPIRASNFALLLGGIVTICLIAVSGGVAASMVTNDTARTIIITSIFGFCTMIAHNTFSAFKLASQSDAQNSKTRHDIKNDVNMVSLQQQETAMHVQEVKHEVERLANYQNGRLHAAVNAASDAVEEEGRSLALNEEGINRLKTTWMKTMQDHLTKSQVSHDEGT